MDHGVPLLLFVLTFGVGSLLFGLYGLMTG